VEFFLFKKKYTVSASSILEESDAGGHLAIKQNTQSDSDIRSVAYPVRYYRDTVCCSSNHFSPDAASKGIEPGR